MPYDEHDEHVEMHKQSLEEFRREQAEEARVERWWTTYNAALTGLRAWSSAGTDYLNAGATHREATSSANLAHGELPK